MTVRRSILKSLLCSPLALLMPGLMSRKVPVVYFKTLEPGEGNGRIPHADEILGVPVVWHMMNNAGYRVSVEKPDGSIEWLEPGERIRFLGEDPTVNHPSFPQSRFL